LPFFKRRNFMGHPVPKELRGEERLLSFPKIGLHFNQRSLYYNGPACVICFLLAGVVSDLRILFFLFITLNGIAYPLGHIKLPKKRYEGGYLHLDTYIKRMLYFKYKNTLYYVRRHKKDVRFKHQDQSESID